MAKNQMIGRWGEEIAEKYFTDKKYVVIGKNIRTPYGELDLVLKNQEGVIFVEVKTRTTGTFGYPETSVSVLKKSHIIQSAESFMQTHEEISGDWRIDVIAIQGKPGFNNFDIEWFENVT